MGFISSIISNTVRCRGCCAQLGLDLLANILHTNRVHLNQRILFGIPPFAMQRIEFLDFRLGNACGKGVLAFDCW